MENACLIKIIVYRLFNNHYLDQIINVKNSVFRPLSSTLKEEDVKQVIKIN